jgi:hypothetical protein
MRKGLTTATPRPSGPIGPEDLILKNGWYVLPGREVTQELVDRLIEEADFEDAGISFEK